MRTFHHTGEAEWSAPDRVWAWIEQYPPRPIFSRIRPLLNVAAAFLTGVVATAMLAVFVGAMG